MKREDMMTTYKNLMLMHRSFDRPAVATVAVNPEVVDYANRHGKREAYLYNNRLFNMFINPSQQRKDEYNANWRYINSLP